MQGILEIIGVVGGLAGAALVAGAAPQQRAAAFTIWIASNTAWFCYAVLTDSLGLKIQFAAFGVFAVAGLRTSMKEMRVSKLVER